MAALAGVRGGDITGNVAATHIEEERRRCCRQGGHNQEGVTERFFAVTVGMRRSLRPPMTCGPTPWPMIPAVTSSASAGAMPRIRKGATLCDVTEKHAKWVGTISSG